MKIGLQFKFYLVFGKCYRTTTTKLIYNRTVMHTIIHKKYCILNWAYSDIHFYLNKPKQLHAKCLVSWRTLWHIVRSFLQYSNQKKQSLTSFCAPCYSEIIFSNCSTGKQNSMGRNKSGMEISTSDPSFDIHSGFQNRIKT